jgi:hypothetical protein
MNEREQQLLARVRELEARLAEPSRFGAAVFDEPAPPVDLPAIRDAEVEPWAGPTRAGWSVAGGYLVLAAFVVFYRGIVDVGLGQTSLMFLGLPAFIGAMLALLPSPDSLTGRTARGITMALALSVLLLQEGAICVLMAAPLFYAMGLTVAGVLDMGRARERRAPSVIGLALVVVVSGEGTTPMLELPREEVVQSQRLVRGTPAEVRAALAEVPAFDAPLPLFLRMGFPRPLRTSGSGLAPGDQRVILFGGGEGHPGELTLEVAEAGPTRVVFRAVSDTSHIAHWLTWRTATVSWQAVEDGVTEVTWEVSFRRDLSPGLYFGPWERYAMRLTSGYLIDTLATP